MKLLCDKPDLVKQVVVWLGLGDIVAIDHCCGGTCGLATTKCDVATSMCDEQPEKTRTWFNLGWAGERVST